MIGQHLTDFSSFDVMVEREAHGGFGRVYMGADHRFHGGEWFALKTLHPRLLATERGKRVFLNECLTWMGLWPHANLLTAQTVTEINGQLFLVLDYAEQGNLRELIRSYAAEHTGQPLPLSFVLFLAQQVAAGLAALHTPAPEYLRPQPIVHRDLKPENIMLDQYGLAKITDFGMAKVIAEIVAAGDLGDETAESTINAMVERVFHTTRGVAMGTLAYMAPEQWEDAATVGPPADLYAFGIILGELATGTHPLLPWEQGGWIAGKEQWRRVHGQSTPPSLATLRTQARLAARATDSEPPLPTALDALFQQLLAKHAEERPTAEETLAVLRQAAVALGEPSYAAPDIYPHTAENELVMWHSWANTFFRFGLPEGALARNDRALALAPNVSGVLLSRGNILNELGRVEEALDCYSQALASYPADDTLHRAMVWNQQANALKDAHRHAEAEEAYAQAFYMEPDNPNSWYNRANNEGLWGQASANAWQRAEAEQHWQRGLDYAEEAVRLNPDDPRYIQTRDVLRQLLSIWQ